MSQIDVPLSRGGFGQTQRADNWWVQPLVVFLGLSAFIAYSILFARIVWPRT